MLICDVAGQIDNLTCAWATQRLNGVSNYISAAYGVPELAHQLKTVKCKAIFTCLPLLRKALEAAAVSGIPQQNVFLLDLPAKLLEGATNPPGFATLDTLVEEGRSLPALEPLGWTEGQGARQTALLCCSSGTSGLPVCLPPRKPRQVLQWPGSEEHCRCLESILR